MTEIVEGMELTLRETQVRNLMVLGLNNKDIANHLGSSRRTIEDHRANILKKMGVRNAVEVALKFYNHPIGWEMSDEIRA
jgi:DNA-binding NarL/FixJ family response regulator